MGSYRLSLLREAGADVFAVTVLVLILAGLAGFYALQASSSRLATGVIVKLGAYTGSGLHRPILVQVPDGTTHHVAIPLNRAARCRVGGRVGLVRVGKTYVVSARGCDFTEGAKS